MLLHPGFEVLLCATNVDLACQVAFGLVNNYRVPADVIVVTAFGSPVSAVAFKVLEVQGFNSFHQLTG